MIMFNAREIKHLLSSTYVEWRKQKPAILGAAISFFFIISLGPIMILAVGVVSMIFGTHAAESRIIRAIVEIIGYTPAEVIQTYLIQVQPSASKLFATLLSIPMILFGATMIFFQLKNTLNIIWEVKPHKEARFYHTAVRFVLSFSMVAMIGVLLILLISKSLLLAVFYEFIHQFITFPPIFLYFLDSAVSFLITTLLFAMIYKILPDIHLEWDDVLTGALVTSVLFTIGQFVIGIYLGSIDIDSAHSALGSLTVLLLWIYYSSLIFLIGAVFTKTYSNEKAMIFRRRNETDTG
jgi:membrane protein